MLPQMCPSSMLKNGQTAPKPRLNSASVILSRILQMPISWVQFETVIFKCNFLPFFFIRCNSGWPTKSAEFASSSLCVDSCGHCRIFRARCWYWISNWLSISDWSYWKLFWNENSINLIGNKIGNKKPNKFVGISANVRFNHLVVRRDRNILLVRWNDHNEIRNGQQWAKSMQLVFLAVGNTANAAHFHGERPTADTDSWLWQYLLYSWNIQKCK